MNIHFVLFAFVVGAFGNELPQNCQLILELGAGRSGNVSSGIYKIYPTQSMNHAVEVFCDMVTEGGGWILIQRIQEADFQMDFYRNWAEYSSGFGLLHGSHWQGLDLVHTLTSTGNYMLRIDMMDWEAQERYAEYAHFSISNSSDLYRLSIEGFNGTTNDSFARHNGKPFTTKDNDNDNAEVNCAVRFHGAWWYADCHECNLNGLYGSVEYGEGINWMWWHGFYYSLKRVEMKIRLN